MKAFNLPRLTKQQSVDYTGLILLLMVIGVVGRLAPHWPNVTPIGALAVWGGMRLGFNRGLAVVVGSMIAADIFLGFSSQSILVYAGLVLGVIIASLIQRATVLSVTGITLVNAAVFFLITNNNYLYAHALYPKNWTGLIASYEAGLPFLRLSLLGDVMYVALFFGLELVAIKLWQAKQKTQTVH